MFRRLNRLLHALPGSNLPNQEPRSLDGDLAPEKRTKYTLSQLETPVWRTRSGEWLRRLLTGRELNRAPVAVIPLDGRQLAERR